MTPADSKSRGRNGRRVASRIAAASIACAALAFLVVDVYEVRGNSMSPLLRDRSEARDRLIALRLPAAWIEPERFDVVVFDRPEGAAIPSQDDLLRGDRCVKRVVGLGGEHIRIEGGDLFRDGPVGAGKERLRRPFDVVLAMHSEFARWPAREDDPPWWRFAGDVRATNGALELTAARAGETTGIGFDALVDDAWRDARGRRVAGGDAVNDVGLEFCIAGRADAEWVVELREQGDRFRIRFAVGAAPRIERQRGSSRSEPLAWEVHDRHGTTGFPAGSEVLVTVLNVDDEILVVFDGTLVLSAKYDGNEEVVGLWRNDPGLTLERGSATFTSLRVLRDAYFRAESLSGRLESRFAVPYGELFVLGDNAANSFDSRDFGPIAKSALKALPWFRLRGGGDFERIAGGS
jgi:signal peptidase I